MALDPTSILTREEMLQGRTLDELEQWVERKCEEFGGPAARWAGRFREGLAKQFYEEIRANWLRVLGTAELPHIDQGVRHQFHAKMALLHVFKPQEEPLECIFPRQGPIDTSPQGMNSFVE